VEREKALRVSWLRARSFPIFSAERGFRFSDLSLYRGRHSHRQQQPAAASRVRGTLHKARFFARTEEVSGDVGLVVSKTREIFFLGCVAAVLRIACRARREATSHPATFFSQLLHVPSSPQKGSAEPIEKCPRPARRSGTMTSRRSPKCGSRARRWRHSAPASGSSTSPTSAWTRTGSGTISR
jgi:hypothetical protein